MNEESLQNRAVVVAAEALNLEETIRQQSKINRDTWDKNASWESPTLFGENKRASFPTYVFPDWLRQWIYATAEALQVPVDLAGNLALIVIAAACARKFEVFINESWHEPLNLFVVTSLPSGSRKSATFSKATEPLIAYEKEQNVELRPKIAEAKSKQKILERRLKKAETRAAATEDEEERENRSNEAAALQGELDNLEIPEDERVFTDDCSSERLATLICIHGRMAVLSPEGDIFDNLSGRYSQGMPNLGVFLKGHAGDPLRVDRVGRPPDYVNNPALTVGLTIQPEVLRGLASRPMFRGRGLIARFLYSLPPNNIGHRKIPAPIVPVEVEALYQVNIRKIFELPL